MKKSFQDEPYIPDRILMGPGPSHVSPRVLASMAAPLMGHLDPDFLSIMNQTMDRLRYVFETENQVTVAMSGTGSCGMEAAFVNFLEPGDDVVIGVNGLFGQRMTEVCDRIGARVHKVEAPWGQPLDADEVRSVVKRIRPRILAVVHAETSTGVCQPLEPMAQIAREGACLLLVDAVTSLGGMPVGVDQAGIDIAYAGTQKCLSCPPGLAPLTAGERAMEVLRQRETLVPSWYLDLSMIESYWGEERFYHHTAPINMIYALNRALSIIQEEGLEPRFRRHLLLGHALQKGLTALGLKLLVPEAYRLPMLTSVHIPQDVSDMEVRGRLLREYGIEIGGGLGALKGKIWRVGLMGHSASPRNLVLFLTALGNILRGQGFGAEPQDAVTEALRSLTQEGYSLNH